MQSDDTAQGFADLAEPDLATSASACQALSVSLLPTALTDVCELAGCDYDAVPLPATTMVDGVRISLHALGWRKVGDLSAVSPLALLTLRKELFSDHEARLDAFWATTLSAASSLVAPLLFSALAQPLERALALPSLAAASDAPRAPRATPTSSYSALIFEPEVIVDAFLNRVLVIDASDIWAPSEPAARRHYDPAREFRPFQESLLSAKAQRALATAGCELRSAPLAEAPLTVRTLGNCIKYGDRTLADLAARTPEQLFARRNFGPKAYVDIVTCLRATLAPWLARLPSDTLLDAELSADTVESALATPSVEPVAAAPDHPFATLRDSDLLTLLDLYDVPWHDATLAALITHEPAREDLTSTGCAAPAAPLAPSDADSSLAQARRLLAVLTPLLPAYSSASALLDLTLGELIEAPDRDSQPGVAPDERFIRKVTDALTKRLLRRILRPGAWRAALAAAADTLRQASVASLLAELFGAADAPGRRSRARAIEIIYARHGLADGHPRTLEAMGAQLGVTRERVRQMEQRAYVQLGASDDSSARALGHLVRLAVVACGGVATLARAAQRLDAAVRFGGLDPVATTRFLARWSPEVTLTTDKLLVALPYTEALVRQTQQAIRAVTVAQSVVARDDLITQVCISGGSAVQEAGAAFVAAVIETMETIQVVVASPTGSAPPTHAPRYQPSGTGALKSRIVQTMRSLRQPAHFTKIAREYRRLFPEDASRTDNSVHAFFSRFEDTFVLVGSGIFALAEWGYDPAIKNIPALVERILSESDSPLHEEQVVGQACDRYRWQAQSIRAQLTTNPRVVSFGNGFFGLCDRQYGPFDSALAYVERFGEEPANRERLVVGTFINDAGHLVVQVRMAPRTLNGQIPLTSKPIRALFPSPGVFRAVGWVNDEASNLELTLRRSQYDISGFGSLLAAVGAAVGDMLFIERMTPQIGEFAPAYRLACATPGESAGALAAMKLSNAPHGAADDETMQSLATATIHYARKPHKIALLIEQALEHPQMPLQAVNSALNCTPANPAGAEYVRLARTVGLIATGQPTLQAALAVRPTALGRNWFASPGTLADRGQRLALSLPAYRAHVRSLRRPTDDASAGAPPAVSDSASQRFGPKTLAAWDNLCHVATPDASAAAYTALEQHAAVVSTDALAGPALPLLLLLLVAQAQGQGIAWRALEATLGERAEAGLARLRSLGLALVVEGAPQTADVTRVALAERVNIAVASLAATAEALAPKEPHAGLPLAQAWDTAQRATAGLRSLRASDLYNVLQTLAPDALYDALVPTPMITPESARYVDADLPLCGFPSLVSDWALADPASPGAEPLETILSFTCGAGRQPGQPPVGVALCDELLAQPWDAERHLAGNAHLALLTIIAADEGGLAEHLCASDDGWRFDGAPLVAALDSLLRALVYDPWDEGYRADAGHTIRLGQELATLAERLQLVAARGGRLEAVNGLAVRVYYEACDRGFMDLVTAALDQTPALA